MTAELFQEGQILLFNKPYTWTSTDLVRKVKVLVEKKFNIKLKVGHSGTLDPLATGLVIICTGKFTKKLNEFLDSDKEYIATIKLGETTPSFDLEKRADIFFPTSHISESLIKNELENFKGESYQTPPIFSAKRIKGKRAYEHARKGNDIIIEASKVNIYQISLLKMNMPYINISTTCSKGTYIRALARDIGERLNSGAHLVALKRTKIGSYSLQNAECIYDFEEKLRSA